MKHAASYTIEYKTDAGIITGNQLKVFSQCSDQLTGDLAGLNYRHAKISPSNSKLGSIVNVSLTPMITCKDCLECHRYCYALKSFFQYPATRRAWNSNTALAMYNPITYKADVIATMEKIADGNKKNKIFRWHVAGDIPTAGYFRIMVEIALAVPEVTSLCFTKKYELVNAWIKDNGPLPENLKIIFSGDGALDMVNPYNLPEALIAFGPDDVDRIKQARGSDNCHVCRGGAGKDAIKCADCLVCWSAWLTPGKTIIFNVH